MPPDLLQAQVGTPTSLEPGPVSSPTPGPYTGGFPDSDVMPCEAEMSPG